MRIRGTWYLLILFIPSLIIGKDPIDKAISKNLSTIIDLRHQIHQYPEPVSYTHLTLPTNREV